ncbi:MAG: GNAT family N-acetyltransferase [Deltaproteobacteria bacterium]|nr:GNAT family N-acetyltransferase [Deltaproteobacteria bacterium]
MRVVQDPGALDALEPTWRELHEQSGAAVFQSFEWLSTWSHVFGAERGRQPHLVLAYAGERLVGIAPFVMTVSGGGDAPVSRSLALMGRGNRTGLSDHLDIVTCPEYRTPVCRAIARHLAEVCADLDFVLFSRLPEDSPHRLVLLEELRQTGLDVSQSSAGACPRTTLLPDWETVRHGWRLSHALEYRRRRLTRRFGAEFERVADAAEVPAAIEDFMRLHQLRWNRVGQPGVFSDSQLVRFHREVAPRLHRRGWLFLIFLRLGGARVAACYCLRSHNDMWGGVSAVGDVGDASKESPGLVLHYWCLETAAREGIEIFDFGLGQEDYKYGLGAVDRPNWTLLVRSAAHAHGAGLP